VVPAATLLDRPVDVLWVTVKATQLESALTVASPDAVGDALVVPLLNGIDHVEVLRRFYGSCVVAASIAVEAERVEPGHVVQPQPFAIVSVAPAPGVEPLVEELKAAGFSASIGESEAQVLWSKLATLAPLALGTSSAQGPIGAVREQPELWDLVRACATETSAVAATEGVRLDAGRIHQILGGIPPEFRSSMQKDLAVGRPPELEAIAGPITDRGARRGIPTPATEELRRRVAARTAPVA
jgi:2-dehydropantoate 2-reductase